MDDSSNLLKAQMQRELDRNTSNNSKNVSESLEEKNASLRQLAIDHGNSDSYKKLIVVIDENGERVELTTMTLTAQEKAKCVNNEALSTKDNVPVFDDDVSDLHRKYPVSGYGSDCRDIHAFSRAAADKRAFEETLSRSRAN